jgi:tetratricopeptide (TPR) repeat protein
MIGKTVSHYEITEQLGRGGMGIVYKAVDTKLKRPVALKFLPSHLSTDSDTKSRFIQEAQAASALDHANICTIYEIGETSEPGKDPEVYIAMAYYGGQTLKYRLESDDFTPERAADIARQLAAALGRAHEDGIVHRDVKPANIMITDRGEVKLLDFGLAKLLGGAELTHAGSTLGTAGYMSPEQVKGEDVTPASDYWSLGVVLYEMLSGKKPFSGDYEQAAMYAILNETPDDLATLRPELPVEITDIVGRCLSKDPADRPQKAAEIQNALAASGLVSGSGSQTVISTSPAKGPPRPAWLVPAVGVTAVLVAVAAFLLWPRGGGTQTAAAVTPDPAIAVLPFSVGGDPGLDYLRNGMVRLMSTRFDGIGDIRSIDPNALLVQPELETEGEMNPSTGVEVAKRFNAENFIIGSVLRIGGPIQVSANMYDRSGTSVGYSEVTIAADSLLLTAVDRVARELLAGKFEGPAQAMTSTAVQTTSSFEALRNYLQGEELMHEGLFDDAKPLFRSAIGKDSTFALAWLRLSDAYGWSNWNDPTYETANDRAFQLSNRLPQLYRERMEVEQMLRSGNFEPAIARAERLHQQRPDDVQTLLLLGDYQWHYNAYYGKPANDAERYFREILRIDPSLAEAKYHLVELLARTDRFAEAESLAVTTQSTNFERWGRAARIVRAESDSSLTDEQLRGMLEGMNTDDTARLGAEMAALSGRPQIARRVMKLLPEEEYPSVRYQVSGMSGRLDHREAQAADSPSLTPSQGRAQEPDRGRIARMLTFYPMNTEDLEGMAATLSKPIDTTGWTNANAGALLDNLPAITEFYPALVDWRRGDLDALRGRQRSLAAMSDGKMDNNLALSFSNTLEALLLWSEGRIDEADAAFQRSIIPVSIRITASSPFDLGISRFLRGKMLFDAGRHEAALRWLSSVEDGFLHWGPGQELLFPAMYLQAQSNEQLGNTDEAIRLYDRFVRAWEVADPALQPMVEDARERLDALVVRSAQEPG